MFWMNGDRLKIARRSAARLYRPPGKARRSLLSRFWRSLLWIGVAIHVYALALAYMPAPATLLMAERALQGQDVRRTVIPLSRISPNLVYAVIAAEDARFCSHSGIDYAAMRKAVDEAKSGRRLRGASTISQQTAKNVFLFNGGGFARKGAEAWFTILIEGLWGKRRIMEHYLNIAEWGDGLIGAEAAAQARFGKAASELTVGEAALLAAVLPSPNKWRIDPPSDYVSRRARAIESGMGDVRALGLAGCVLGNPK